MANTRLSAALLLAFTSSALAADLEPSPVRPAPVAVIGPIYNWTGFYIGVHGGGGWSKWSGMDPTNPAAGWTAYNGSGGVAGGQFGGNYQIGNFVVGLEGTYAWSGMTLSSSAPFAGGANGSFARSGWLAGVGAEWAFWQNWSVKGEYNYMGFSALTETPVTTGNLSAAPASVKLNIQTAIVGVNYRF
jgi:outer membrane immunogenic protein